MLFIEIRPELIIMQFLKGGTLLYAKLHIKQFKVMCPCKYSSFVGGGGNMPILREISCDH